MLIHEKVSQASQAFGLNFPDLAPGAAGVPGPAVRIAIAGQKVANVNVEINIAEPSTVGIGVNQAALVPGAGATKAVAVAANDASQEKLSVLIHRLRLLASDALRQPLRQPLRRNHPSASHHPHLRLTCPSRAHNNLAALRNNPAALRNRRCVKRDKNCRTPSRRL